MPEAAVSAFEVNGEPKALDLGIGLSDMRMGLGDSLRLGAIHGNACFNPREVDDSV